MYTRARERERGGRERERNIREYPSSVVCQMQPAKQK
jgi:hypothetical protein